MPDVKNGQGFHGIAACLFAGRMSAGAGAFKPYEARGVLKTEDGDASSSCYSSNDLDDQASPRTATSPPTIATVGAETGL